MPTKKVAKKKPASHSVPKSKPATGKVRESKTAPCVVQTVEEERLIELPELKEEKLIEPIPEVKVSFFGKIRKDVFILGITGIIMLSVLIAVGTMKGPRETLNDKEEYIEALERRVSTLQTELNKERMGFWEKTFTKTD